MHARPSRPWLGAAMSCCLLLSFAWLIGYTLGPLPGQRPLGLWNYLVSGLFLVGFVAGGWAWHSDGDEQQDGSPPQSAGSRGITGSAG